MLFLAATVLLADLFYILKNSYKSLSNLTEIFFYLLAASSGPGFNFSNNQGKLLSFRTVSLIYLSSVLCSFHVKKLIVLTFCHNNTRYNCWQMLILKAHLN